jgi:hypothetical protein
MPELGASGSVRGVLRNERPYRERDTTSRGVANQRRRGFFRLQPTFGSVLVFTSRVYFRAPTGRPQS